MVRSITELAQRLGVSESRAWTFVEVLPYSTIPNAGDALDVLNWLDDFLGARDDAVLEAVRRWHDDTETHSGPFAYCLREPCYSARKAADGG